MATIKAIEGRSVHQIQSGQVIVDLYSVIKELVENSLDAGTTSIEIRFKNHGLDSIEVQDNGKGIASEDFETLALKHYTSKLSCYEDLTSLDTFGFRGEALSSLCALSKFHIVTAQAEDGAVGKKLEFEVSGKLKGTSVVAAQKGTTVTVENLFCNLPVRRKELEKNIKREYSKVINHLHAYACISVGVRFAVSNQMPKGRKVAVFSTKANTTTKENITNIFGAKTLLTLIELDLRFEMQSGKGHATQSTRTWSTQAHDRSKEVLVQGHISRPVFGEGRQVPDRQMFFVNSRPCGLPQVAKAFNEVYKSFNTSQSPFVFANLIMDTNAYDVNVSPDKRSIMLHDQTALLESLKAALTNLFEQADYTMPLSQLPTTKLPMYKSISLPRRVSVEDDTTTDLQDDANSEPDREDGSDLVDFIERHTSSSAIGKSQSLIQNWIGRNTEMRTTTPQPGAPLPGLSQETEDSAKSIQHNVGMQGYVEETVSHETSDPNRDDHLAEPKNKEIFTGETTSSMVDQLHSLGTPSNDSPSQALPNLPRPVQDFNLLMDRMHKKTLSSEEEEGATDNQLGEALETGSMAGPRLDVSSFAPASRKTSPGPVQNAFERMRPKRTPLQTAEITIGDKTTTAVIGSSPPHKRRRVHQPANSQTIAQFGGNPLLARGLQNFAAPGTRLGMTTDETLPKSDRLNQSDDDEDDEELQPRTEEATEAIADNGNPPSRNLSNIRPNGLLHSEPLNSLTKASVRDNEHDEDYLDDQEDRIREKERVARLVQEAELTAARPTDASLRRASQVLKNGGNRKESTLQLAKLVNTSTSSIRKHVTKLRALSELPTRDAADSREDLIVKNGIDDANAEARLSLTVNKTDFERMIIVGQFNLGFILAVRPANTTQDEDELFIIDQHAADEKYNYERLQRTVTLQNQRLVRPKPLQLTAVEEEIVLNNADALNANGFEIETTSYALDDDQLGTRCHLITLPISGEKTFDLSDLEELLHLLSESPSGSSEIPRPRKVQKMLAMRACRSSIMVGKTLTLKQMQKVVKHMGEMEKPWNCPHGRPTMRHLAGLGAWDPWQEGDIMDENNAESNATSRETRTDWKTWLECKE